MASASWRASSFLSRSAAVLFSARVARTACQVLTAVAAISRAAMPAATRKAAWCRRANLQN